MRVARRTAVFLAVLGTAALLGLTGPAFAASAPNALRGKSVTASWTENRMQRSGHHLNFRPRSVPQTLQIYISSEGRTFERRIASRRGRSGVREGIGGGTVAKTSRSYFQGRALILAGAMRQGARQVRIEFSPDFSSCSTKVIVGTTGREMLVKGRSMISGKRVEFELLNVSDESCSIQNGNIFGN
jgi:hypothetical protein